MYFWDRPITLNINLFRFKMFIFSVPSVSLCTLKSHVIGFYSGEAQLDGVASGRLPPIRFASLIFFHLELNWFEYWLKVITNWAISIKTD